MGLGLGPWSKLSDLIKISGERKFSRAQSSCRLFWVRVRVGVGVRVRVKVRVRVRVRVRPKHRAGY